MYASGANVRGNAPVGSDIAARQFARFVATARGRNTDTVGIYAMRLHNFHYDHRESMSVMDLILRTAISVLREDSEIGASDRDINMCFSAGDGVTAADFVWAKLVLTRSLRDRLTATCASRVNANLPSGFRPIELRCGDLDPTCQTELLVYGRRVEEMEDAVPLNVCVYALRMTGCPKEGINTSGVDVANIVVNTLLEHIENFAEDEKPHVGVICQPESNGGTMTINIVFPGILLSEKTAEYITEICASRIKSTLPKKVSSRKLAILNLATLKDQHLRCRLLGFYTRFGITTTSTKRLKVPPPDQRREGILPTMPVISYMP